MDLTLHFANVDSYGDPQYVPDRPGQVSHIRLDLDLNLDDQILTGTCTLLLIPIRSGIRNLQLDAVQLQIHSVQVNGTHPRFAHDGSHLDIDLDQSLVKGESVQIQISYSAVKPQRGIYFIQPTPDYPDKPTQVWTRGEDEDSRYWFPCFDYPGQLATSEVLVTVPAHFRALSR